MNICIHKIIMNHIWLILLFDWLRAFWAFENRKISKHGLLILIHFKHNKKFWKTDKTSFLVYFGPFFHERVTIRIFPKNLALSLFSHHGPLTAYKMFRKMSHFLIKRDRQSANGQTDEGEHWTQTDKGETERWEGGRQTRMRWDRWVRTLVLPLNEGPLRKVILHHRTLKKTKC